MSLSAPLPSAGTILLADDDQNDAFLVRRALIRGEMPYNLLHVLDGEQCINYLAGADKFADRVAFPFPNLVIVDLKMPKVSGSDVLSWIQTQSQLLALPVVVMSGSILPKDREQCLAKGAREFHTKPMDPDDMVTILRALASRWLPG
jgi:CheY-like chemotaxis protein